MPNPPPFLICMTINILRKSVLIIMFPGKDTKKIKHIFHEANTVNWLYLGQDIFKKRNIINSLEDKFKLIDVALLLDRISKDIKHEYVRWIDNLNRNFGENIDWWFGAISSREVTKSNLYQYCCYLELLEKLWDTTEKKPALIVLESKGLTNAILKWAEKKNVSTRIVNYSPLKYMVVKRFVRPFCSWCKFAVRLFVRWFSALTSRRSIETKIIEKTPSLIIDTFLHDYCLSNNGEFKDRYFPHLHEFLSKKNIHVLVHPILYRIPYNKFISIYKRMRKSNTIFIIQEDFLFLSDYISALTYPFRLWRLKIKADPFRDNDLSDILKEEKIQKSVPSGMEACLIYRLFIRLGESGLKPLQIINWYENQVIDKALIAGARRAFTNVTIIGAQMFIHPPNYLNLFPCQSEVEAGMVPDLLLETSQYQCKVAQSFTRNIHCKSAAALRYKHVFDENKLKCNSGVEKGSKYLVLLPHDIDESIELLEILKEGLDQITDDAMFLLKAHPDYDPKDLLNAFGKAEWPPRFNIYDGNLQDALNQASIVISSNSSSMVEAAVQGIPVIFIGRQTVLNNNLLSDIKLSIITECFYTTELIEAINKYSNLSEAEINKYKEMGRKIRNIFFTPINEETMSPYLIDGANNRCC